MKLMTYQSATAWPDKRWLCVMDMCDNGTLYMNFFAATEQAATDKANAWWDVEKAKQLRIMAVEVIDPTVDDVRMPSGRGAGFLGKVWMLNRSTGARARIEASEIGNYEAKGYVRGGPRSQ